jgi:hypothetical protein
MPKSEWSDDPPRVDSQEDFNDYMRENHAATYVTITDPGDSTATTVSELKDDHNKLLANLRTAGLM